MTEYCEVNEQMRGKGKEVERRGGLTRDKGGKAWKRERREKELLADRGSRGGRQEKEWSFGVD